MVMYVKRNPGPLNWSSTINIVGNLGQSLRISDRTQISRQILTAAGVAGITHDALELLHVTELRKSQSSYRLNVLRMRYILYDYQVGLLVDESSDNLVSSSLPTKTFRSGA
jgi:hypothetical protein